MSIEEIMERERLATEEAILRGNYDALNEEIFSPDAIFHMPPFPDIHGIEGFKQFLKGLGPVITELQWNWDEVICIDNTAVQRYSLKGKHTGTNDVFTGHPTGKEVSVEGCVVYHLKDNLIVEFFEYSNFLGLFMQLGMVPPI